MSDYECARWAELVKDAGGFVADAALEPTIKATLSLLEFTTRLVSEFTDPERVLQYQRSQGRDTQTLEDLRALDLKELDEFTRRMSMKWRGIGTAQGAALGLVATLPVAGCSAPTCSRPPRSVRSVRLPRPPSLVPVG